MRVIASFLIAFVLGSTRVDANDLRVLVSAIDPIVGEVHCLLFKDDKGFPMRLDRASAAVEYAASGEMLTCTFPDVEPGRYAVSVFHDLDGNDEFDGSFRGNSEEQWGVTNNVRPGDRAPGFVEAVIYVGSVADYEVTLGD